MPSCLSVPSQIHLTFIKYKLRRLLKYIKIFHLKVLQYLQGFASIGGS